MSTSSTPLTPTPFKPSDFLRLAKELSTRRDDEAALRSAVSRAYYAAFWVARDVVSRRTGLHELRHDKMWRQIKSFDWSTAEDGMKLRRYRNNADYEKVVEDSVSRAEKALIIAGRIIKRLAPSP